MGAKEEILNGANATIALYRERCEGLEKRLAALEETANSEIERLKAEQGYDRQAALQAALERAQAELADEKAQVSYWKKNCEAMEISNAEAWPKMKAKLQESQATCVEALKEMRGRGDAAYLQYSDQCRRTECLGADAKIAAGKFGRDELTAHQLAQEWLGKHRAYHDAANIIANLPASVSRFVERVKALEKVAEAAREAVGVDRDGKAKFQPECEGSADDLLSAITALEKIDARY